MNMFDFSNLLRRNECSNAVNDVDRTERIELRNDESSGRGMTIRGRGGAGRGMVTDGFNRFGKREFERHSGSDRT